MDNSSARIGFIGLGVMGFPMARNLVQAGYHLIVHNRSSENVEKLVGLGSTAAETPKRVAEQSDIIITMLPDSPDVEHVVLGEQGVCHGVKPNSLFIDMSTIDPASTRHIHESLGQQHVEVLDAPVSGGEKGAMDATLSIMVGGSREGFNWALPILKRLGTNIVHMGKAGAGQVTKACNQVVVALTIQAISEALTLAGKAGVDPERVRLALLGGFAQSRILDQHGSRMIQENFTPGFRLRLHHKDLKIALATSREAGVPLVATATVTEQMNALIEAGHGELDHAALINLYRQAAELGQA